MDSSFLISSYNEEIKKVKGSRIEKAKFKPSFCL